MTLPYYKGVCLSRKNAFILGHLEIINSQRPVFCRLNLILCTCMCIMCDLQGQSEQISLKIQQVNVDEAFSNQKLYPLPKVSLFYIDFCINILKLVSPNQGCTFFKF